MLIFDHYVSKHRDLDCFSIFTKITCSPEMNREHQQITIRSQVSRKKASGTSFARTALSKICCYPGCPSHPSYQEVLRVRLQSRPTTSSYQHRWLGIGPDIRENWCIQIATALSLLSLSSQLLACSSFLLLKSSNLLKSFRLKSSLLLKFFLPLKFAATQSLH